MTRDTAAFLALCLIWGATWIGIKAGVTSVPPLMFAGTRFTVAGLLILGLARLRAPLPDITLSDTPRLLAVSGLMIPLCYGPLFWGMKYVDSGTAAVLELSLTPVALLAFALMLGEEPFNARRLWAILLGVTGLAVLFGPEASASWRSYGGTDTALRMLGMAAIASAAVIYAAGSVLARPLLRRYPAELLAGSTTLIGGIVLILTSLAVEPGAVAALAGNWGWPAWAGWWFLVLFGSLVGYTLYMRLLRDIGASRAGAYAFVSPVVAVLLGIVTYGETVSVIDVTGMAVMLVGAYLALQSKDVIEVSHSPSPGDTP